MESNLFSRLTLGNVVLAVVILILAGFLVKWQSRLFAALSEQQPRARFFAKMLEPIIRILIWFCGLLIVIQILAPSENAFVAALGSAALALGLGAQDLIKNAIGGIVVLANRPYQVGDRVKIEDAYGEITQIGLQSTRLVTPTDTEVTIPNAKVMGAMTFNSNSGVPSCQVVTDLYLPPDFDPDLALHLGREAALSSMFLHLPQPVVCGLIDGFTEAPFMIVRVRAYVYDHQYEPQMQSDITRRFKAELLKRGLAPPAHHPPPSTSVS